MLMQSVHGWMGQKALDFSCKAKAADDVVRRSGNQQAKKEAPAAKAARPPRPQDDRLPRASQGSADLPRRGTALDPLPPARRAAKTKPGTRMPAPSLPPRPQRRIKKKTVNALRQHPLKYTQKPHCAWQKTGSFRDNPGRSLFFAIYLRQLWLIAQSALRFL